MSKGGLIKSRATGGHYQIAAAGALQDEAEGIVSAELIKTNQSARTNTPVFSQSL
jgi:hypothetical protein